MANAQPSPPVVGPQTAPAVGSATDVPEPATEAPVPNTTTSPSPPAPVTTAPGLTPPSSVPIAARSRGANLAAATPGTLPAYRDASPYAAYPPPGDEPVYQPSYRWQLAMADLGTVALMFSGSDAGLLGGVMAYTLVAPTIHLAHDEGSRAAGSLGLRVGLPLLGALAGAVLIRPISGPSQSGCFDCGGDDTTFAGAAVGVLAGMATAMVIDDLVLGRPRVTHKHTSFVVAPRVSVAPQQTTFGLAGSF
ncbi:MAG TPA: hypothetical protein VH165_22935 [Kofleriaceae bacterium]|nr:hypothetical protein [Kofleriaceae bacterium]